MNDNEMDWEETDSSLKNIVSMNQSNSDENTSKDAESIEILFNDVSTTVAGHQSLQNMFSIKEIHSNKERVPCIGNVGFVLIRIVGGIG